MKRRYIIDAGRDGILNKTFRSKKSAERFKKKKEIKGRIKKMMMIK